MPFMPPKPCATPRCRNKAKEKGRCEDHQPEPWFSSKGKTPTERGYGYQWQKIRGKALLRDGHLCQICLKTGRITTATEVDHILNKARGGTDSLANLQAVCKPCHTEKTLKERSE